MVSDRAESCPKCGYSVSLSMEQKGARQAAEHASTVETGQEEVAGNAPQPRQKRSKKKGLLIAAIVAVMVVGCGVLYASFSNGSDPVTQQIRNVPSVEAKLRNVATAEEARQLVEGTVWEHTVNTDESELGFWVKVEFANGRYRSYYMQPSDEDWTGGGEGRYEIREGKFANTGEKYIAVYWEGRGYRGWPMKYALVLNNFQITVQSAVPDLDVLYSYEPQPTSSGFMKLVDVFEVSRDAAVDGGLPSDTLAVAPEDDDFVVADSVVADSCAVETPESITLYGSMTDANGTYPIELAFEKRGDLLMNCIYTNVDLGGKIRMDGEVAGNDLVFTGRDGNNAFRIVVGRHTLEGYAQDGSKRLQVSLSDNQDAGLSRDRDNYADDYSVQEQSTGGEVYTSAPEPDDRLYTIYEVDAAPEFMDGGQAGLIRYISQNLQYPNSVDKLQGSVVVRFVIERNGDVSDLQITQSLGEAFDREACRVVLTTGGKWRPARKNGNAVRAPSSLPMTFRIN